MGCLCHCAACHFGFVIGFYLMMMSFGTDIKLKLNALNEQYQVNGSLTELVENLGRIIRFRSDIVELSILLIASVEKLIQNSFSDLWMILRI